MNRMAGFLIAFFLILLSGCASTGQGPSSLPQEGMPASPPSSASQGQEEEALPKVGSGAVEVTQDTALTAEQKDLLLAYMDLYYESLAHLEVRDPSSLFVDETGSQAIGNRTVWDYLVRLRRMQRTDLSLVSYRYTLSCRSIEEQEDGTLRLMVVEKAIQNFAAHPQVDSETLGAYHSFTLAETGDGWRIASHMQMDSLYFSLFGGMRLGDIQGYFRPGFQMEDPEIFFAQRLEDLLAEAGENMELREETAVPGAPQPEHPYDREAAVEYAQTWVESRNEEWPDYGRYGGNCQNYVSQCLLTGGIPMDPYGSQVWKWYGDTPNNLSGQTGRSASWSSVEAFRSYASDNSGYGLSAQVEAPYYSGEAGDILQLGTAEAPWRHTVIVTQVVRDDNGETVDYLVNSNTADLRNFPAGAYIYTRQSLVKVYGWND